MLPKLAHDWLQGVFPSSHDSPRVASTVCPLIQQVKRWRGHLRPGGGSARSQGESHSVVSDSLQPHIVHAILQARLLGWVAIPFSGGSSRPRGQTQVSRIAGRLFAIRATREAPLSQRSSAFCSSKGTELVNVL